MKLLQKIYTSVGVASLLCGGIVLPTSFLFKCIPSKLFSLFSKKENENANSVKKVLKIQGENQEFANSVKKVLKIQGGNQEFVDAVFLCIFASELISHCGFPEENLSDDTHDNLRWIISETRNGLVKRSNSLGNMKFYPWSKKGKSKIRDELQRLMKNLGACLEKLSKNYPDTGEVDG